MGKKLTEVILLTLGILIFSSLFSSVKAEEYMLKKVSDGYAWFDKKDNLVSRVGEHSVIKEIGSIRVLELYTDGPMYCKIYNLDNGEYINGYSGEYLNVLYPKKGNYFVIANKRLFSTGKLYFINENGEEITSYEIFDLKNNVTISDSGKYIVLLSESGLSKYFNEKLKGNIINPSEFTGGKTLIIFDNKGSIPKTIDGLDIGEKIEFSKSENLVILSDNGPFKILCNVITGEKILKSEMLSIDDREKLVACLGPSPGELVNRNKEEFLEYIKILQIEDSKISELADDVIAIDKLIENLIYIDVYSIDFGEKIGRIRIPNCYKKYVRIGQGGHVEIPEMTIKFVNNYKIINVVVNDSIRKEYLFDLLDMKTKMHKEMNEIVKLKEKIAKREIELFKIKKEHEVKNIPSGEGTPLKLESGETLDEALSREIRKEQEKGKEDIKIIKPIPIDTYKLNLPSSPTYITNDEYYKKRKK